MLREEWKVLKILIKKFLNILRTVIYGNLP